MTGTIEALALVLAAYSANTDSSQVRKTQCKDEQPAYKFEDKVIPSVELLAGIQTGMTREEVKRVAPGLSIFEGRKRLELFEGISFGAKVAYEDNSRAKGVYAITLTGDPRSAPIDALTERYGSPMKLGIELRGMDTPGFGAGRVETFQWCDGPRVFILSKDDDQFELIVTAEERPN